MSQSAIKFTAKVCGRKVMLFCLTAHMHLEKIQRYVHKNKQMKYLSNQVLYKRDYFSVVGVGGFQTFIPGITGSVISSVDFDL